MRSTVFTSKTGYLIWYSGASNLAIVNMSDISYTLIKGFLPNPDNGLANAIPLRCVAKNNCQTILLTFLLDNEYSLAFFDKQVEPDVYILSDKFPGKCKTTFLIFQFFQIFFKFCIFCSHFYSFISRERRSYGA